MTAQSDFAAPFRSVTPSASFPTSKCFCLHGDVSAKPPSIPPLPAPQTHLPTRAQKPSKILRCHFRFSSFFFYMLPFSSKKKFKNGPSQTIKQLSSPPETQIPLTREQSKRRMGANADLYLRVRSADGFILDEFSQLSLMH